MFRRSMGTATAILLICLSAGQVEALTAVKPLEGYACMNLTLTRDQLWNAVSLPPVYATPAANAKKIGTEGATVIVVWPKHEIDGFVEILRLNGQHGWLAANMLRPYHSDAVPEGACTPSMMSNGRIGFSFGNGRSTK